MSTPIVEGRHFGEFILGEANHNRSREVVTISDGVAIKVGQVLGKVTADGKYTFYNNALADGTQVAAAIAMYPLGATDTARKITVVFREATINGKCLEWNGASAPDQAAGIVDLAAQQIIVR